MDTPRIIVMWRGDQQSPQTPTRYGERLAPVMDALRDAGMAPEPLIYFDARAEDARHQLRGAAAVLVWVNPIADGESRVQVDALLREAAAAGARVSAHPDVIAKMGVKEVLHATRALGWGSDTDLYGSVSDFDARFAAKMAGGARVLKPNRGNDGRGVLKVARRAHGFAVQHAFDDAEELTDLAGLRARLAPAFANGGQVIDQKFHAASGMVRCYMCGDRVVGFGEQVLRHQDAPFAMNSAKAMHSADHPPRIDLRTSMETEWTPGLRRLLGLAAGDLPLLWDADFLLTADGYRLCEINVSCVSPFPPAAPQSIAATLRGQLRR